MSARPEVPQFGALLRAHIDSVPDAARPAFLAGLERSAAARYRDWASRAPQWSEELLGCARREDEIADLVDGLFPVSAEDRAAIERALPGAIEVYYDVFAPFGLEDQLYLQAEAELQGALAWVRLAEATDSPEAGRILARCTDLERESSVVVRDLLATVAG